MQLTERNGIGMKRHRQKEELTEQKIVQEGGKDTTSKKRRKRKKAPVLIAVAVVVLLVVRVAACGGSQNAAAVVSTVQAVRGDLQDSVSTSGTVQSEQVKVVFAPVTGTIAQVNVAAGDAVNAGELLVSYDTQKLENSMRESELQLQKSNASYNSVLSQDSENQWKLYESTHNLEILEQQITDTKAYIRQLQNELDESQRGTNNAIAKEEMELGKELTGLQKELAALTPGTEAYSQKEKEITDVNNALSYYSYLSKTAAESDYVSEMQQKIEDAQEMLSGFEKYKSEMEAQKDSSENSVMDSYDRESYSADRELAEISYQASEADYALAADGIVADFAGIVTECSAVSGGSVSGGMQLLTLESSENLKISFMASKSDIEKLALGQQADVVISGKAYKGEVSKINRMAEKNETGTPMVGVELHLLEADDNIILGMDAKVTVYTQKAENALLIPVEAINADRNGDFLYVVENGAVARRAIACGISTDTYTEVLEGISEEDAIIVSSYTASLEEGMAVTAIPAD